MKSDNFFKTILDLRVGNTAYKAISLISFIRSLDNIECYVTLAGFLNNAIFFGIKEHFQK